MDSSQLYPADVLSGNILLLFFICTKIQLLSSVLRIRLYVWIRITFAGSEVLVLKKKLHQIFTKLTFRDMT